MSKWYVEFPTFQYNEDVKALAKERGLTIIDAKFDEGDGVKDPRFDFKGCDARSRLRRADFKARYVKSGRIEVASGLFGR